MKLTKRPSWALGALAAGASIAVTIGLATPARAANGLALVHDVVM
jgi:hypothetical protein